jgi:hypothetical protein
VDVERVQVEAGAPHDLDRGTGQGRARAGRAPEGRHAGRARRRHAVAAVVVGVPVRVEAEPRGRPDLDERERRREHRERGEQGRAAGGDVRLVVRASITAATSSRRDRTASANCARGERSLRVLDGAEQQRELPRVLGQGGQEGEEVGVAADVVRERRVQRRPPRRLEVGEAPVPGDDLSGCRRRVHGPVVAPPRRTRNDRAGAPTV